MVSRRSFIKTVSAAASLIGLGQMAQASLPDGFYVPPEEDRHELCFMQWPVTREIYPTRDDRDYIQEVIARIANTISEFEPVVMLADKSQHKDARRLLGRGVALWDIATDDLWCRDSGPLVAVNDAGDRAVSGIQFNGWGNRYKLPNDRRVSARVAEHLGVPHYASGVIGEAGGAEANGHGLVLANESGWINRNRNPGASKATITQQLKEAYGADQVIWGPGVAGLDVTDDHIDGVARFTGRNSVLFNGEIPADPQDPFGVAAEQLFQNMRRAALKVDVIPLPFEGRSEEPGAYVNYYVCNGGVVASQFGDPETDDIAYDALKRHYPGREIIMLDTDALTELGGGIHCATQQLPAV